MSVATPPVAWTVRRPEAARRRGAREDPLARAFTWSVAATGAIISSEAAIPLSPGDRALYQASSVPVAVVLVTATALVLTGRARRNVPGMVVPWVGVLSVAALSVAWSESPARTVDAVPVLASLVAMLLAVVVVEPLPRLIGMLERGVVWGGAAGALWGVVNFLAGTLPEGGAGTPRFTAVDAPNATAAAMLLPFVLAFSSALRPCDATPRGEIRSRRSLVDGALAAMLVCGMLITGSRGGLLAAVAAALILLVIGRSRVRPGLVAGLVVVLAGSFLLAPPALQDHLTATHSTGRTGLWSLGIEACERHCIVGSGHGTFPSVYAETFRTSPNAGGYHSDEFKAHNIWLEAAVETGLLGVLVLLVAVAMTIRCAWRAPPRYRPTALAAFVSVVVATMFLSHLPFRYFWLILVYVVLAGSGDPADRAAHAST